MENIVVRDEEELERKIENIREQGREKLHVLSDFDRTFTKFVVRGIKTPSLIFVLRDGSYLTKDYAEKAHALFNKYHPIEINPDIPMKEKGKAMMEWWRAHFDLLIKSGLNKKDIEKVVKSDKTELREGALNFIELLHKKNVPLVILSSNGLGGDSISLYFKKEKSFYDNIHIISNSYIWDDKGNAIGVREPIIHSLNKAEIAVKNYPIYKSIKNRKNVLLIGDTLEDLGMIEGFDYENLISVGFLDEDVEKNLELYKKAYDVVILNDGSFDYVNGLVKKLIR